MERKAVNIPLRTDLRTRAEKAIDNGVFPGIKNLSGLIEKALEDVLNKKEVS